MSNYTMIAEIGNALIKLLRKELVPDMIKNDTAIGLASPAEKGDMALCVYLYDVKESERYRMSGMICNGENRQKFPPVHLTLFYMITAFSSSDVKFRSDEEQRILGRVIQVLHDYPILNPHTMEFGTGGEEGIRMEMDKADMDEKTKVWNFPNLAPKLSLFYHMGPVPIESAKTKTIKRVQEVAFRSDYVFGENRR